MNKKILLIILILSSILVGCANSTPATTATVKETTTTAVIPDTPTPTKTAAPAVVMDFSQYSIDLTLDYDSKQAQVSEIIRFQNNTGEELSDLVLGVEPNLWDGCFSLESIKLDGELTTSYTLDGQRLTIPFTMASQQIVEVSINYDLSIPRIEVDDKATIIRTQVFGYTSRQVNLVDWYPFVVPYTQGEGWLLNEPATYGEHLAYDSADFEVTVHLTGDTVPVTAASGSLEQGSGDGDVYKLDKGRSFAISFSPDYLLKTQEIEGIKVQSYYFAGADLAGQAALDATVQALGIYNKDYGPYQHSTLSIVQEETGFSMEYDGLYFLERPLYYGYSGQFTDTLPTIAAHETAHQWWFALVGTDQANQPWLDEALATYSERLFNESISQDKAAWWQAWRLYLPEGNHCPIDITIYGFYNYGCFYTESVYVRGALFVQSLRDLIGDEAFFSFTKEFATRFAHQRASTNDFFEVLREHTDKDLTGIMQEYFKGTY